LDPYKKDKPTKEMRNAPMTSSPLPIAIIGAGPIGLAAAAHLLRQGETPLVLEAGSSVGATMLCWGHVRLFSPWRSLIDHGAAALLDEEGWNAPDPEGFPTGRELVEEYLVPLASVPQLQSHLSLRTRVLSVTRQGLDKMKTPGRGQAPFVLRVQTAEGGEDDLLARAVIDASGTYEHPNPLGVNGTFALGERALHDVIFYGLPDVRGQQRERYTGRRVLVVGSGHSALNVLLDLAAVAGHDFSTRITWAIRRPDSQQLFGAGEHDALPARSQLGQRVHALLKSGTIRLVTTVHIQELHRSKQGILIVGEEERIGAVDEIIATTGFRPDLSLVRELRVALDPAVESPLALAPLIDPNVHSCGTVPPHGVEELAHPEQDFYIVGMKSYGRAPTFLTLTGYEQVRSIVAALSGDWERARQVELVLPETDICSTDTEGSCAFSPSGGLVGPAEWTTGSTSCCAPPSASHLLTVHVARRPIESCCR
jgi:thioredoxin reductase